MTTQALAGLTILELGHLVSAAYATKLLADLGAEVIKIEEAGTGDEAREIGPFPGDVPHPERSGLFLYLNANKRGITLNVASHTGQVILRELVKSADILVHNYAPSVAQELGLHHAALSNINPQLITLSLTPYGETGPYKDFKAYELNTAALAGVPLHLGEAGREPLYPSFFFGPLQQGLAGAVGLMLAVTARDSTGRGQHIDLAEADVWATFHTGLSIVSWLFGGRRTRRQGQRSAGAGYPFTILPCKDGYVRMLAQTRREWRRFLDAMGNPAWGDDPRFQDRIKMNELYSDELDALITPWLMERTKQELFEIFYEYGVPFSPIKTVEDMVNDPQLQAGDDFVEFEHPEAGTVKYPGAPYRFSRTPWEMHRPAPLLGQHNEEVLCRMLGYSPEELANLRRTGVI